MGDKSKHKWNSISMTFTLNNYSEIIAMHSVVCVRENEAKVSKSVFLLISISIFCLIWHCLEPDWPHWYSTLWFQIWHWSVSDCPQMDKSGTFSYQVSVYLGTMWPTVCTNLTSLLYHLAMYDGIIMPWKGQRWTIWGWRGRSVRFGLKLG